MDTHLPHVETRHDARSDVVLFRLWGQITADHIIRAIEDHFSVHRTARAVWDFRRVDLNSLSVPELVRIARRSMEAGRDRVQPQTALVMRDESNFLLGRLYDALAESGQSPIRHRVFFDMQSAWGWLGVEDPFAA